MINDEKLFVSLLRQPFFALKMERRGDNLKEDRIFNLFLPKMFYFYIYNDKIDKTNMRYIGCVNKMGCIK